MLNYTIKVCTYNNYLLNVNNSNRAIYRVNFVWTCEEEKNIYILILYEHHPFF